MKSVWMVGGGCFSARVRTIEGRVGNGTILLSCAPAPTFWQNSYPGHHKYGIPAPSEPVISGREVWWGGRESDLTVIRELAGSKPTVGTSRRFFLVLSCVVLVLSCVFFVWRVVLFFYIGALLDSGGTTKIPRCGVSWPLVPTPPTPCIVLRFYASECCMGHVRRVSVVSSWAFSRTQVRQRALPRQSRVRLVVRSPDSCMGTVPIRGSALRTTRRTLRHEVGLDDGGGLFQCACAHDSCMPAH